MFRVTVTVRGADLHLERVHIPYVLIIWPEDESRSAKHCGYCRCCPSIAAALQKFADYRALCVAG